MKINLVVERQWHIAPHAAALEDAGWDYSLLGGFPRSRYVELGIPSEKVKVFPYPALWNYAAAKFKFPKFLQADAPDLMARWSASKTTSESLVICYSTVYRHLFPRLDRRYQDQESRRPTLVIERGSTHPEAYFHAVERGRMEAGLPWSTTLPTSIQDEIEAGSLAHFVVAGSTVIKDSYRVRGVPTDRILTIPYGTDPELFKYYDRASSPSSSTLHIACVGYQGIRKGIGRLLKIGDWAKRRGISLLIHLVGPMESETPAILSQSSVPVKVHGVKKGVALVEILHACDLYCLPSYEEGFGISVIEAMATGLPAIVSEETGAREAISLGEDGILLSDYSDDALDVDLGAVFRNRQMRLQMGIAAREKVLSKYTHAHYERCLHLEYERMFACIEADPNLKNLRELNTLK